MMTFLKWTKDWNMPLSIIVQKRKQRELNSNFNKWKIISSILRASRLKISTWVWHLSIDSQVIITMLSEWRTLRMADTTILKPMEVTMNLILNLVIGKEMQVSLVSSNEVHRNLWNERRTNGSLLRKWWTKALKVWVKLKTSLNR